MVAIRCFGHRQHTPEVFAPSHIERATTRPLPHWKSPLLQCGSKTQQHDVVGSEKTLTVEPSPPVFSTRSRNASQLGCTTIERGSMSSGERNGNDDQTRPVYTSHRCSTINRCSELSLSTHSVAVKLAGVVGINFTFAGMYVVEMSKSHENARFQIIRRARPISHPLVSCSPRPHNMECFSLQHPEIKQHHTIALALSTALA